jgi:DNA topoisomerase III
MRLDDVTVGKADFRAIIDQIAGEADRLIRVLQQHSGGTVDLGQPVRTKGGRSRIPRRSRDGGHAAANPDKSKPKRCRPRKAKNASHRRVSGCRRYRHPGSKRPASGRPTPPITRMVAFAERLAKDKRASLPSGYDKALDICRRFLDQQGANGSRGVAANGLGTSPPLIECHHRPTSLTGVFLTRSGKRC